MQLSELDWAYVQERAAYFTGRGWVFARLDQFLHGPPGVFLLIGEPGTGKTAVAAQLALAAAGRLTPAAAGAAPHRAVPVAAAYFCRAGRVDLLDAAQRLSDQLAETVPGFAQARQATLVPEIHVEDVQVRAGDIAAGGSATGVRIDLSRLGGEVAFERGVTLPLRRAREAGESAQVILLVDALDESHASQTAKELPRLLGDVEDAHLVVTARPDRRATGWLWERAVRVDLLADAPPGSDDVLEYLQRRITPEGEPSAMAMLAQRIAEQASGNFLYAFYVVEALRGAHMLAGLDVAAAREVPLPEGDLPGVYRDFLRRELWRDDRAWATQFGPVLAPLAVAQDEGLTTEQLRLVAGRLAGEPLTRTAIRGVTRTARQFLDGPAPDGPFRVYHQSFADFLVDPEQNPDFLIDAAETHEAIVAAYAATDPLSWDSYARRNLALHASEAGQLDHLLEDAQFLLAADPARLVPHLDAARSASARAAAAVYRQAPQYLTGLGSDMRASQLELHAHRLGYHDLATSLATAAPDRAWRTRWSHRHADLDRQTPSENNVLALTVGVLPDGAPVVVSGGQDGTVRVWRLADGTPLGKPIAGHPGGVTAVATTAMPDATPVVVSGGQDGTVRVWRLADGTPVGKPIAGHPGGVTAVATTAMPDATPVVVSGGQDGTVRVWRLADGTPVAEPITGYNDVHVVAAGALPDGTPVIISGANQWLLARRLADGTQVWGPITQVGCIRHPEDLIGYITGAEDLRAPEWAPYYRTEVGWGAVEAIAVAGFPGGIHVVVSSGFRYLFMWRLTDGGPAGTPIICDGGTVIALAVAGLPDGTPVVITGDYDGNVGARLLTDGAPLVHPLRIPGSVRCIAIYGDIVVTAADADVAVHQLGVLQRDRDLAVAQGWYEFAAAGNDPAAMINLGVLLMDQDPAAAQSWFERVSGSDPEAMFNVGVRLIDRDPASAQSWFEKAAAAGNTFAMKRLLTLLTNQEPANARSWFEQAPGNGAEAMFNVGVRLIDRDPASALRWFERSAGDGDRGAMVSLGMLLRDQDSPGARSWFERAAGAGNATAMNRLALLLLIDRDVAAAQSWFERTAEAGDTDAMFVLGMLLYERDPAAAQRWWEQAAEIGRTDAMTNLGTLVYERDPAAAQRWWEQAAEAGDTNAMTNLGTLLQERDPAAAQRWWERAAAAGHTGAIANLGRLLQERDPAAAQRWWEQAAEAGDTNAMTNLGTLLQERNPTAAQTWYERAAEAGHTGAMTKLGVLVYERDPAAAQRWWEQAAETGDTDAMFVLGTLLHERNPTAAQTWYERAAEAGHTGAMTNLGALLQERDPAAAQTWYERAAADGSSAIEDPPN